MKPTRGGESKQQGGPGFSAAVFPLVIGAFFFVGGMFVLTDQIVFASHGTTTTATVVGYRTHNTGGKHGCGGPGYYPVVSFADSGGRQVTATLSNRRICDRPAKGETVRVEYDGTDPSHAKFPGASNWATPVIAVAGGGLFLAGGVAVLVSTVRRRKAAARGEPIPGSRNQRKKRERAALRDR